MCSKTEACCAVECSVMLHKLLDWVAHLWFCTVVNADFRNGSKKILCNEEHLPF